MELGIDAARNREVELQDLPDVLIERVIEQLSSTRDLGRAGCVCRAWRAGDSPVERTIAGLRAFRCS